ncbi:MAG: DUF2249 domain-containing protein [Gammaproteobacteria bacterium]|nr:DUF2249 domain-containing protein [Gammaproteobacteria bacterium]MCB1922308.1 DUF2249 domain-containing protein [Gammaproteobacteria bacterium]
MEQMIDVSGLEPPEPLERIIDTLADLADGDWLRVRHRRDPVPLYRMLRDMGYSWDTTCVAPEHFEVLIWPEDMARPGDAASSAEG